MIDSLSYKTLSPVGSIKVYVANGVDNNFKSCIENSIKTMSNFSLKSKNALSKLENVLILKNSDSYIPDSFSRTKTKLDECAKDAYGFVSRNDKAIVINEENHQRKDAKLEGDVASQAADTFAHEIGHLIDEEYSTSYAFQNAYLQDLKNIEKKLSNNDSGSDFKQTVEYLKHYMEGADFSDGIDEKDITREGLRENFAECFSTIVDDNPSEINDIYASLFPNTMKETLRFVI